MRIKKNIKKVLILLCASTHFACNEHISYEVRDVNLNKTISCNEMPTWLLGSWKNTSCNEITTEKWTKINDTFFICSSKIDVANQNVYKETRSIQKVNKDWYFTIDVREQNAQRPFSLKLTGYKPKQLIFEDSSKQEPLKKICYNYIEIDSITVQYISKIDDVNETSLFSMKRIK